jgi:hypothetical protein
MNPEYLQSKKSINIQFFYYLQSFKPAQVVNRSGPKIVEEMAKEIKYMMDAKVSAIKVHRPHNIKCICLKYQQNSLF